MISSRLSGKALFQMFQVVVGGFPPGQLQSARRLEFQPGQVHTRQPALAVPGVPQLDVALDEAPGVAIAHGGEHQLVLLHRADLEVRHRGHVSAQPRGGRGWRPGRPCRPTR